MYKHTEKKSSAERAKKSRRGRSSDTQPIAMLRRVRLKWEREEWNRMWGERKKPFFEAERAEKIAQEKLKVVDDDIAWPHTRATLSLFVGAALEDTRARPSRVSVENVSSFAAKSCSFRGKFSQLRIDIFRQIEISSMISPHQHRRGSVERREIIRNFLLSTLIRVDVYAWHRQTSVADGKRENFLRTENSCAKSRHSELIGWRRRKCSSAEGGGGSHRDWSKITPIHSRPRLVITRKWITDVVTVEVDVYEKLWDVWTDMQRLKASW